MSRYVEIKKEGEWDMFDLISSAYYGKRMYFKQDDGTVYSRYSYKYMSVDEAIREFVSLIDDSDLPDVKAHWDKVEVRSGEWWHTCSKCKATWGSEDGDLDFNFCPNCGAEMEANDV